MPPSRSTKDSETKKARVLANRYEIVRRLGCGNYGTAFLCKDIKYNDQLKVLKEIPVDLQPDETVDAMRESRLLSKLDHPGIVKFHDSFIEGEFFCIITEYCEGGDLDHKINEYRNEEKSFDEKIILDWTIQLLMAAQYIHSRRVLHRDLKTRNIFIRNNLMKIGDFGISRILMGTTDMASTFAGTPYYMSPEVLKHEGYNSKSDVWSIGCIMYELCTLEHAFSGQGLMAIMYKIVEKDPPDLPSKYSKELNEVFKKMLIKDPEKRPSATDVLKFPYIARHMEKMKEVLTDEYKIKHNINPETADREASDIDSLLREKPNLEDLRSVSENSNEQGAYKIEVQDKKPSDKKPTPRERLRLKKKQEADKNAQELKKLTKIQLVENTETRQKIKANLEKTNLPVWKGDDNESATLKDTQRIRILDKPHYTGGAESGGHYNFDDSEEGTNTEFQTVTRRNSERGIGEGPKNLSSGRLIRSFSQKTTRPVTDRPPNKMNATIGGTYPDDRPITPMRDRMVYGTEHSSLDFKDGIPGTPEEANTFYEQYNDFDDDDDVIVGDSEETVRHNEEDFINHLEHALRKDDSGESTIVNDDTILGAYGPHAREKKIMNIREECKKILGQEEFDKAYNYLKTARSSRSGKEKSEKEIMDGLRKYMKNPSDCFLVDQLLFLEEQAKLS